MSQTLWILDPDPTSAQAMRNAVDLLGPDVETFAQVPALEDLPNAIVIAGAVGAEQVEKWTGEIRRKKGADLLPITIVGGLSGNAEALAIGADHFLATPLTVGELTDHLGRFLSLNEPDNFNSELDASRGWPERNKDKPNDDQNPADFDQDEQRGEAGESDEKEPFDTNDFAPTQEVGTNAEQSTADDEQAFVDQGSAEDNEQAFVDQGSAEDNEQALDDQGDAQDNEQALDDQGSAQDDDEGAQHGMASQSSDDDGEQVLIAAPDETDEPASDHEFTPPQEHQEADAADEGTEDLFGLKQPQEVKEMSGKSGKEEKEIKKEANPPPAEAADFADDSAWGLNDLPPNEEASTAGWGDESSSDEWGESNSDADGWSASDDDDEWGGEDAAGWGGDSAWGGGDSAWSESPTDTGQPKARLQSIGQQLVAPSPKPRAPVGSLAQLGPTGVLGLLARCGKERISGRINLQSTHESLALYFEDGRLIALNSASFDDDLLQGALAQGWIDSKELAAIRHLQQRRHSSAAAVLVREGVRDGGAIQKLAQETAERCLLRTANHAGGEAAFLAEMDTQNAVSLGRIDAVTRIISLAESLVDSALWTALVGGDDAIPDLRLSPLPQDLPGREALHLADGQRSLLELATASGVSIAAVRIGCLAALALGQVELQRLGLASIQRSHRPDRAFDHAIAQIQSGDYFAVLGLADAHSELEVRRAFSARVTLLRLHLSTEHPRFAELYNELEEAREVLLDPDLRAQYRTANPKMAERPWPCETS